MTATYEVTAVTAHGNAMLTRVGVESYDKNGNPKHEVPRPPETIALGGWNEWKALASHLGERVRVTVVIEELKETAE